MTSEAKSSTRTLATLLLGAALVLAGVGLFQTLLPLRAGLEKFSATAIGFLGTAYFGGFIAGWMVREATEFIAPQYMQILEEEGQKRAAEPEPPVEAENPKH